MRRSRLRKACWRKWAVCSVPNGLGFRVQVSANRQRVVRPEKRFHPLSLILHPFFQMRAFLFDIGNVLLRFDFGLALQKLAAKSAIHNPAEILLQADRIKVPYEDGQIDRAAFLRAAFDLLQFRGSEAEFITAWEEIFEPNLPMVELLDQLRPKYPLYLLSNTSDIHREYIFRTYAFFGHFTGGIYSYEARTSKPGAAIFHRAIDQFRLTPETTFFIDDLLPNIETARSLGFVSHHYHHDRHSELLTDLRKLQVIE